MKVVLEKEAEGFLEKQGFTIVPGKLVKKKKDIGKLKGKIDFPWAVKVYSKKIVHKAKAGGVILNIANVREAELAFDRLSKLPGFEGTMIQEMMNGKGQLLIFGLKKTPEFGLVIMVGEGGGKVEQIKDISFRVTPINLHGAKEMIKEIKIKVKNPNLVVKNLLKLSKIAQKNLNITELDINPLVITKTRAVVVDARIVINGGKL